MVVVASFDVFDTLLTRAVGTPQSAFLTLGRRLLRAGVVEATPAGGPAGMGMRSGAGAGPHHPGARERVEQARSVAQRLIFASDMYLPHRFVEELLRDHGLWRDGDRCYVSCAWGSSKQSGPWCRSW